MDQENQRFTHKQIGFLVGYVRPSGTSGSIPQVYLWGSIP